MLQCYIDVLAFDEVHRFSVHKQPHKENQKEIFGSFMRSFALCKMPKPIWTEEFKLLVGIEKHVSIHQSIFKRIKVRILHSSTPTVHTTTHQSVSDKRIQLHVHQCNIYSIVMCV